MYNFVNGFFTFKNILETLPYDYTQIVSFFFFFFCLFAFSRAYGGSQAMEVLRLRVESEL